MNRRFWTTLLPLSWCLSAVARNTDYAHPLASLIDPAKLATLGPRGANPRVQKAVHWLETARQTGQKPENVLDAALRSVGMKQGAAEFAQAALLQNPDVAGKLECLDTEGMAEMRKGNTPDPSGK